MKEYVRRVVVFEDHFIQFKKTLSKDVLKKIYQVFLLIMTVQMVPEKFLRPIRGRKPGLYEIRIEEGGNIFRVFCCFDEGSLVVLFNVIQKKSQKSPQEAIAKAYSLMDRYFEAKKKV